MLALVVLLLLKVGDSFMLLSIAQGRSDFTRYERFACRGNRHRYILHVSAADLWPAGSWEHCGACALQGGSHPCRYLVAGRAEGPRDRDSPFGWRLAG